jgi:hypothetical protein
LIDKTLLPVPSELSGLFPVKPFRSPYSPSLISTLMYRVHNNTIALYDPFGYLLDTYTLTEKVVSVAPPSTADDMFLAVLTDTDYLYLLQIAAEAGSTPPPPTSSQKEKKKP